MLVGRAEETAFIGTPASQATTSSTRPPSRTGAPTDAPAKTLTKVAVATSTASARYNPSNPANRCGWGGTLSR